MSLFCAVCDQPVHGDMDHVRVSADMKRIDDQDEKIGYLFHTSCCIGRHTTGRTPDD